MRRWLARLSFSLLVIGVACAWDAYTRGTGSPRGAVTAIAAGVCFGAGVAGLRARHRSGTR